MIGFHCHGNLKLKIKPLTRTQQQGYNELSRGALRVEAPCIQPIHPKPILVGDTIGKMLPRCNLVRRNSAIFQPPSLAA